MPDPATTDRLARLRSTGRASWDAWPVYAGAELGLRNFWYPLVWSRDVRRGPFAVQLLGERIVLVRDGGKVYALSDRCLHRGVPLHLGKRLFPGTISCPYHGWTYALDTGVMCAAITDGPSSPICGKVALRTYPVEERLGLVWVFAGDGSVEPPPVESDIPDELLSVATAVRGTIRSGRHGNWRLAAENGFDEGHAKFLHRHALWAFFRQMPVWTLMELVRSQDGIWASRRWTQVHWDAEFPGLGRFTQRRWWKLRPRRTPRRPDRAIAAMDLPGMVSVRVPYVLRVAYSHYIHYEWAVPEDAEHHRYVQLMASFKCRWWQRAWFCLEYGLYIRWAFHGHFTGQDAWMVSSMDVPPERLYRPDTSVLGWRKLVEEQGMRRHIGDGASASASEIGST